MCVGEGEYMCRMSACIYSTCTHHSPIASVVKEYLHTVFSSLPCTMSKFDFDKCHRHEIE